MTIKSTDDYEIEDSNSKFMLVGEFGTGKSEFASTFPTPGFVFNWDKKIKAYADKGGWDYAEYDLSAKGWIEFERDFQEVTKLAREGKYKTIVGDSTTSFTDLAMERALALDPKRSTTQGPVWNVHYQMVRNLVEGKIRQLVSLPCNIVLISHLSIITDQETGAIIAIEPMLTGQLAIKVPGYFEEVYCCFTKQKEGKPYWYMRTTPRGLYKARSEMRGVKGLLPDELPNNYQAVMEAYHKAVEARKKKGGD